MKKWMLFGAVMGVAILGAVVFAIPALSQSPVTPPGINQAIGCPGAGGAVGGYGMMGGGYMGLTNPVTLGRVADTLGVTTDQLTARLQQGETIAQVAQAQDVSTEAVVATVVAPQAEMMQVAVKYGFMTESQVQAMLDQMELWAGQAIAKPLYGSNVQGNSNGTFSGPQGFGGMMGGNFGGGMMGGGFGGGMMGGWNSSGSSTGYGPGGMMGGRGGMMGW